MKSDDTDVAGTQGHVQALVFLPHINKLLLQLRFQILNIKHGIIKVALMMMMALGRPSD